LLYREGNLKNSAGLAKRYGDRLEIFDRGAVVHLHSRVRIPYPAPFFLFNTLNGQYEIMSIQIQKKRFEIHDYDQRIAAMMRTIRTELSPKNSEFILKYDREMVQTSLAKATRRKHLEVLLIQTRMLNKDWDQAMKNDIDNLVYEIMQKYSDDGKETNCTADHKKVLKIFYRWLKLGSREHRIVGDPIETKNIVTAL
jgi:hypothetical protein